MSSPPHYLQLNQNGVTGVTTAQVDNLSSVYRQLFSSLFAALDAKLVSVHKDNTKLTGTLSGLCGANTMLTTKLSRLHTTRHQVNPYHPTVPTLILRW